MTDSKLKAIVDAPSPRNAQELQVFLGLFNYYGLFILNCDSLTQPLNSLLYKERCLLEMAKDCAKAFKQHQGCSGIFHFCYSL